MPERYGSGMKITPVILCGGSGTRLWPLSRQGFAKQYADLLGDGSTFQQTVQRVSDPDIFDKPIILTGRNARFLVADQARRAGVEVEIVLEPEGRDSLAAIAAAAEVAARRGADTVLIALSSDHLIPDTAAFTASCQQAAAVAARGRIVVLGVTPDRPAEKFGYIRPGAFNGGVAEVAAFTEKPDAAKAATLIAEGALWNAGMFCFRADVGLSEIAAHAPEAMEAVRTALATSSDDLGAEMLGDAFLTAPRTSFDYGVMEKTALASVIEARFPWSDVGDWKELWAASDKDDAGVVTEGDVVTRGVARSYIRGQDRLICAINVEGLAIIDTHDAVLVAPLDQAQEVKALVAGLAEAGRPEAVEHARVYRPWGWYQTIDQGPRFRVKHIQVDPGKQLSLQMHHHRSEHWTVVTGAAEVTVDEDVRIVNENESVYVPVGAVHRLANPGKIAVKLIEVQTGAYLEEDDIIRLNDDFGRA